MPNNSYIGAIQIDSGDQILIGSTLFGICGTAATTAAKVVTLASFDQLLQGVTVQVKFTQGNTVASNATLKVNSTDALPITGNFVCDADQVIAFTYENVEGTRYWRSHHNIGGAMPIGGGTFTGTVSGPAVSDNSASGTLATVDYVRDKTAGLSGLTGAMHFKGELASLPDATNTTTFNTYDSGDVVLISGSNKEYVYFKGADAPSSKWIELGDEGSYVLQTSQTTDIIDEVTAWNDGSLPSLTVTPVSIPNVTSAGTAPSLTVTPVSVPNVTNAGSVTTASVSAGILNINIGSAPTLGTAISVGSASDWDAGSAATLGTAINIGSASNWSAGTKPSLSQTPTTVVVPVSTP